MIERNWPADGFVVSCDYCSNDLDVERATEFAQAVQAAKREGWRIEWRGGDWHHRCPACVGKAGQS